jgi:hypothetical protein
MAKFGFGVAIPEITISPPAVAVKAPRRKSRRLDSLPSDSRTSAFSFSSITFPPFKPSIERFVNYLEGQTSITWGERMINNLEFPGITSYL